MNRKLTTAAALAAALLIPATAHADGSSATFTANCQSVTVNVSGLPTGAAIYVEVGSQPPYGFTVGQPDPWSRFTVTADGGSGSVGIFGYEAAHGYGLIIDASIDGTESRLVDTQVACDIAPEPPAPITLEQATELRHVGFVAEFLARFGPF